MRSRPEIYGQLDADRKALRQARKDDDAALVRFYEKKIAQNQGNLKAIRAYGGEAVPMRTPWKRMARNLYEEL